MTIFAVFTNRRGGVAIPVKIASSSSTTRNEEFNGWWVVGWTVLLRAIRYFHLSTHRVPIGTTDMK